MHICVSQNDRAVWGGSVQGSTGPHPGLCRGGWANGAAPGSGAGESSKLMDICTQPKSAGSPISEKHLPVYLYWYVFVKIVLLYPNATTNLSVNSLLFSHPAFTLQHCLLLWGCVSGQLNVVGLYSFVTKIGCLLQLKTTLWEWTNEVNLKLDAWTMSWNSI